MYEQPYNPFVKNLSAVKSYFKSPSVLLLGIMNAVSAVLALISAIMIASHIPEILLYIKSTFIWAFAELNVPSAETDNFLRAFDEIQSSATSSSVISSAAASLGVALLISAAFLIIYFKSRNESPASTPNAGVTILFAFSIVELVGVIFILLAFVALFVLLFYLYFRLNAGNRVGFNIDFGFASLDDWLNDKTAPAVLLVIIIVGLVVLAIAAFLLLFTSINKVRYYGSVRKSLNTVELQSKGAKPYGVMCVLGAVSAGVSLLSMPSALFVDAPVKVPKFFTAVLIVSLLSQAAAFVTKIFEAKVALCYKTHIDAIKYGYATHAAPAASYSPFAAGAGYGTPQEQRANNPYLNRPAPAEPAPFAAAPVYTAPVDFAPEEESITENSYSDPYGADAPDVPAEPAAQPAEDPVTAPVEESEPAAIPTCPVCGAEIDPTAPFCGNCGNRL